MTLDIQSRSSSTLPMVRIISTEISRRTPRPSSALPASFKTFPTFFDNGITLSPLTIDSQIDSALSPTRFIPIRSEPSPTNNSPINSVSPPTIYDASKIFAVQERCNTPAESGYVSVRQDCTGRNYYITTPTPSVPQQIQTPSVFSEEEDLELKRMEEGLNQTQEKLNESIVRLAID